MIITIPLFFFTNEVLSFWLGSVPEYTVCFVQLVLIHCVIRSFHPTIDTLYMALGDLKKYQVCEGVVLFLPVIFSYILLYLGIDYYVVFILLILFEILNTILITLFLKGKIDFPISKFLLKTFFPSVIPTIILYYTYYQNDNRVELLFILLLVANYVIFFFFSYFILFNNSEISIVKSFIIQQLHKKIAYDRN